MKENLFLWYPRCSTCRKAQRWLEEHGVKVEARDIKEDKPGADELRAGLLASDGMLVKRPLFIGGDFVLVGFREKEWQERLGC